MRPISKCVFFLLVSSNVLNAQLVRPGELIKRKSDQRVNQKIEGAIDGALDKVFGVGKSKQGASNHSLLSEWFDAPCLALESPNRERQTILKVRN